MGKKILKVLGILLVLVLAAGAFIYFNYLRPKPLPISAEDRAAISLMPLPATLKLTGDKFWLTAETGISVQGPESDVLADAVARFSKVISARTGISLKSNSGIEIHYDSVVTLTHQVNEVYQLIITKDKVALEANTQIGVLRGLETLKQFIQHEGDQFYWPTVKIKDTPRYAWRGLMIDVGRHFMPKEVILRNLEAMAAVKMNVLHWHLSDYQGFRVESKRFPKLHELGSNSEYYTQDEIREIVAFAQARGIRIVPEFDMPGHSSGFLTGYPELASAPGPYKLETTMGIFPPVMDPTREEVYQFLDQFVGEMTQLFPDTYFHIGGDEVSYAHWDANERIQDFMKQQAIADNHALQAYFNERLEKILANHNRKMIGWDEILNPNLSHDVVVQSWRSHKSLIQAVQNGSQAILSSGYYLDHKLSAAKHYSVDPEVMSGAVTIKPDSLRWQEYVLELEVTGNKMPSNLVVYGGERELRGLFFMMENAMAFEQATRTGNQMNFSMTTDYGTINGEVIFIGDSIAGELSLGLLSFPLRGNKKGGHDWPGTTPPKVEQIKPLTDVEKKRILGGEAAMWTELVNARNLDSRVWPRAAAMAEKWWSPAELTKDPRDMYRRLETMTQYLETLGVQHLQGQTSLIAELAAGKSTEPIRILVDALQEVGLIDRFGLGMGSTLDPLNEVVDVVAPESLVAVRFNQQVDDLLADPNRQTGIADIQRQLTQWRNNHLAFQAVAQDNPRLEKVILTSEELSRMSHFALQSLDAISGKQQLTSADQAAMKKAFASVADKRAGVYIAVKPALEKLVDTIPVH